MYNIREITTPRQLYDELATRVEDALANGGDCKLIYKTPHLITNAHPSRQIILRPNQCSSMNLSMHTDSAPIVAHPIAIPCGPDDRAMTPPVKHPAYALL